MRPLKLSMKPFCIGLPSAMKCQGTRISSLHLSMSFEVNSVPRSETIISGFAFRLAITSVNSRATRAPEIDVITAGFCTSEHVGRVGGHCDSEKQRQKIVRGNPVTLKLRMKGACSLVIMQRLFGL